MLAYYKFIELVLGVWLDMLKNNITLYNCLLINCEVVMCVIFHKIELSYVTCTSRERDVHVIYVTCTSGVCHVYVTCMFSNVYICHAYIVYECYYLVFPFSHGSNPNFEVPIYQIHSTIYYLQLYYHVLIMKLCISITVHIGII